MEIQFESRRVRPTNCGQSKDKKKKNEKLQLSMNIKKKKKQLLIS